MKRLRHLLISLQVNKEIDMKKNYLSPVIDIVEINAVDIITASGTGLSDNSLDLSVWSDFYDFDEQ